MRKTFRKLLAWLAAFGIDPFKGRSAIKNLPATVKQFRSIKHQNSLIEDTWSISFCAPYFQDQNASAGVASGHYFHQDLFVARRIHERTPEKHVDVGSSVEGFVAHVAVFREIEVFDIRPIINKTTGITFIQKDIMVSDSNLKDYTDSLSCLHALEHFGLGRYGDPIDVDGYKKGFEVLTEILRPGGMLYLSVPIGKDRVEFNGQRVFSLQRVYDLFQDKFRLHAFSYVDDSGDMHENVEGIEDHMKDDLGLHYGCGIFELVKL
jgi:hypothetical protein